MSGDKTEGDRGDPGFGFGDFMMRFLMALVVVLLTFNPSGYSFFHWAQQAFQGSSLGPLHFLAGLLLLCGWILFVRATMQSMGTLGVLLVGALFAVLVWMLFFYDVVEAGSTTTFIWIALLGVAVILTVGMSWAHIRRRLSGQSTVDEVRH
jgi:hypothetical protein